MGEPAPGIPPTERLPEDRLDSWKETLLHGRPRWQERCWRRLRAQNGAAAVAIASIPWLERTERFWRTPLANPRFHTAPNRDPSSKVWPSSTGLATGPAGVSQTGARRPPFSFQTVGCDRTIDPSSQRMPNSKLTFRYGRQTQHLSTLIAILLCNSLPVRAGVVDFRTSGYGSGFRQ
jgi:hypothetical protein